MGWEVGAWGEGWLHFCLAFLFTPGGAALLRSPLVLAVLFLWAVSALLRSPLVLAVLFLWGASALLRSPLVERGEELAATPQCIRETFGFPNRGLRPGKIQSGKFSCKQEICHLVFWHCSLPSRTL